MALSYAARRQMVTSTMPRLLKTIEQQVRLFSVSGLSPFRAVRRALYFPYRVARKYRQSLAACNVIEGDEFDQEHNVETSVRVCETDLAISNPNWIHALPYLPTPNRFLSEALAGLDIRFEDFTFIDLGSGKGRVLLMASEFPFRDIVGVEISPDLTSLARQNISAYRGAQKCRDIKLACIDFSEFEFPGNSLFVFLFNPASLELTTAVARNLMRSLRERPREVRILYVTPDHHEVFDSEKTLKKVGEGERLGHRFCLYTGVRAETPQVAPRSSVQECARV